MSLFSEMDLKPENASNPAEFADLAYTNEIMHTYPKSNLMYYEMISAKWAFICCQHKEVKLRFGFIMKLCRSMVFNGRENGLIWS